LPMGLQKFEGDDARPTMAQIVSVLTGFENCNKDNHTLCVVICHSMQMHMVEEALHDLGYPTVQPMTFHKLWKSDKRPNSGMVSAVLFAVLGWKDVKIFEEASLPSPASGATPIDRLMLTQTCWHLPTAPKPTFDIHGNPINECPQSPMIPERFINM